MKKIEARETFMKTKGQFSFLEWNSGAGDMSVAVASSFPNATVFSVARDGTPRGSSGTSSRGEGHKQCLVRGVGSRFRPPFDEDAAKTSCSPELVRLNQPLLKLHKKVTNNNINTGTISNDIPFLSLHDHSIHTEQTRTSLPGLRHSYIHITILSLARRIFHSETTKTLFTTEVRYSKLLVSSTSTPPYVFFEVFPDCLMEIV